MGVGMGMGVSSSTGIGMAAYDAVCCGGGDGERGATGDAAGADDAVVLPRTLVDRGRHEVRERHEVKEKGGRHEMRSALLPRPSPKTGHSL